MIFPILGLFIGLFCLVAFQFGGYRLDLGERVERVFSALAVTVGFGIAGVAIGLLAGMFVPQHAVVGSSVSLAALQDNKGLHGSFFLGSGTVDSEPVYFYVKRLSNGGFQEDSFPAKGVTIFQDETDPRLITYKSENTKGWMNWVGIPTRQYGSEVHVPPNSIVNNYKIDAQ